MVTPSISTSTFVLRVQNATGVDQRSTSSTALGRIASSARYRSISFGIGDERLQPGGQRVFRRVAAGEGQHEEEDLELVGGDGQLLAVLVGDDRGGQRAPDVVGRVAPLLRGEFERVREDLAEQLELLLLGQLRVRRIGLQDAIERVEDLRPVFVGDADDVADDRHRQHVGDVVDPVAAAGREQPVDHRGGPRANALLELADGLRGEGV